MCCCLISHHQGYPSRFRVDDLSTAALTRIRIDPQLNSSVGIFLAANYVTDHALQRRSLF